MRGRFVKNLPLAMVVNWERPAYCGVQAYLGDQAEVNLHLGTRVTGYAPNSEDAISKLMHAMQATVLHSVWDI